MADPTQFVEVGGLKFLLPPTAKIVTLYRSDTTSGDHAMFDSDTQAAYQVPALKKLWILRIDELSIVPTDLIHIYQANASGGTDTEKWKYPSPVAVNLQNLTVGKISIPTTKFLTVSSAGVCGCIITAIELDA